MIKLIIIFTLISIFPINVLNAQQGWFSQLSHTDRPLRSVFFIDNNTGWACGSSRTIIKTTDGGQNWSILTTGTAFGYANRIFFIDNSTGWVACANDSILKSTDGGTTWSSYHGSTFDNLFDIYFINSQTGWAVGLFQGLIRKTTNGGISWDTYFGGTQWTLLSIYFINEFTGWAAGGGSSSVIIKSTNGGINWFTQSDGLSNRTFWDLQMVDEMTGWAAGGTQLGTTIAKTTNSGSNWFTQETGVSTGFISVSFVNSETGWMSGSFGKVIKTTNSGVNWTIQSTNTVRDLWSVFFISKDTGWAVGEWGEIIKTTTGGDPVGIMQINSEIPDEFSLYQNYPNPFNPVTKIKFDITQDVRRETQDVKLIVYDLLGKEVEILVNEKLSPGSYEIEFDASSFSSGIYFYKFESGNFIETKRMTLIK